MLAEKYVRRRNRPWCYPERLVWHLGGAGLDVLQREVDGGNPFADLPQVLVTPHLGRVRRSAGMRILQMALANIGRVLSGQAAHHLVPGT